jgi:hypothetical protein
MLSGFDPHQAMSSFPLLIRILPARRIKEEMIVLPGLFVVFQVIESGSAQKVTDGIFG